jgi:lactoylglutathione lyase
MKLTDVRLLVDDVDRSVGFYRDVVGLEKTLQIEEGFYAEFAAGEATLALYRRDLMEGVLGSNPDELGRPGSFVLTFAVDDVDAMYEQLRSNGAEPLTEPHDQTTWGLRVCHFRDPDGHQIELYRPL